MAAGKLLNFAPARSDSVLLHTADWSAADLPDAPDANRLIAIYEERFGHPVRASHEVASTGAPQIEIRIDTSDLPWLDRSRRRLFAGESLSEEDRKTWRALGNRIGQIKERHDALDPQVHFPFTAAASIATTAVVLSDVYTSTLIGYRALCPNEKLVQDIDFDLPVPTGSPPPDRFEEGGHLFRFMTVRERDGDVVEKIYTVLIDSTGVHTAMARHDPRKNGALAILDTRRHRMPEFLKPMPAIDRTVPPLEYRVSLSSHLPYGAQHRDRKIEDIERHLGVALHMDESEHRYIVHIDLTDLNGWPSIRDRLLGGVDVAADREVVQEATRRLGVVLEKMPRAHLSDTAAILVCLSRARTDLDVSSLRLAGVQYIHPYQLEKMSNWDKYPKTASPPPTGPISPVSPDNPPSDFGIGCLFEIDGNIERGWYEP